MGDIRDDIFRRVAHHRVTAAVIAEAEGLVAETGSAERACGELGLTIDRLVAEGSPVRPGDQILRFFGRPMQVALAEERLIGLLAKPSGIATAARRFVERAGEKPRVVCGAWKKMPPTLKEMIRRAISTGGAGERISPTPFLYLDKNYVRMMGGIRETLEAVVDLRDYLRVVQMEGAYQDIALEAEEAALYGADIIFVDSGRSEDVGRVTERLNRSGVRNRVEIAFGGNIRIEDIAVLKALDLDVLDVGRQIVDAPLLDMRLEVVATDEGKQESI